MSKKQQPRDYSVTKKDPVTNKLYTEVIMKNDPTKHALKLIKKHGKEKALSIASYFSEKDVKGGFWKNAHGFMKRHLSKKAS